MKRTLTWTFIACLAAVMIAAPAQTFAQTSAQAAQTPEWQKIPIPKLSPFKPQAPKRIVLPNGMIIFLQEDHELPLIDGTARIRGGEGNVPAEKLGLNKHLIDPRTILVDRELIS